jgi:hypothetical protein
VAGIIGSAIGAWYFSSARRFSTGGNQTRLTPAREHGTVIFHNTPEPASVEDVL